MNKTQPIKQIMASNCEFKRDTLSETRDFGNDWGLFVEIDIIDTKHVNKYNCTKNTFDPILEEDDIEKNLEENYVMKPNSPNKKRGCYKLFRCFSSVCLISLMTYFIICVI
jgi:hypothetical protein